MGPGPDGRSGLPCFLLQLPQVLVQRYPDAPSVIVSEERAALINPAHPDGEKIKAKIARRFEYNELFRRG